MSSHYAAFRRMPAAAPWALLAAVLLLAHQGWNALGWRWGWADAYLDDVCGMLVWLTFLEWEQRRLWQWRNTPFSARALLLLVAIWSLFFEGLLPRWHAGYTADPWDVLAYVVGAAVYFFAARLPPKYNPAFRRMQVNRHSPKGGTE